MPKDPRKPRQVKPVFRTTRRSATLAELAAANQETTTSDRSRAFTLRTDAKGRSRGYRIDERTHSPNPLTAEPQTAATQEIEAPEVGDQEQEKSGRKRQSNTTSSKLQEWLSFRQGSLDELLRHDGLGSFLGRTQCITCGEAEGGYKCRDCFDGSLLRCQKCLLDYHKRHPLHRIEHWNGSFFEKASLQSLGLRIQLGHGGLPCHSPSPGPLGFCVVDLSGIHYVSVDLCDCLGHGIIPSRMQMLRAGWFPATFTRPKTVFTFEILDTFHELTLQGKTTAYDFYQTILRKTDNLGLDKMTYRFPEFHRVFRIWRGLLMLKRAGRGQDPAGVDGTAQGELAIDEILDSFLHTQFLACNANFKLRLKNRGINDPELAPGWAYFVHEERYQAFLKDYVDQPEINTCQSEHDALVRAAIRCTPGYTVTGTALVLCPHHGLVRKNGVRDLQKGERFCNMDYAILSSLSGNLLPRIVITYDIGCQWSKHFRRRMEDFPSFMHINENTNIDVGIPSWHINGHGPRCQSNFSLSYMQGVGRTCGEEVETSWAQTNALGASTREMGPGARHETLNDQWGGCNFRKITGFRKLFVKRLETACVMRDKHCELFAKFSGTFSAKTIEAWQGMIWAWNADHSNSNPYEELVSATTLQDVRLELAKEDAVQVAQGAVSPHKASLTSFLVMGLELEEQQRQLHLELDQLKGLRTSKQLAELEEKRTSLCHRIQSWREVQLAYTPCIGALLVGATLDSNVSASELPLLLPSSLPDDLCMLPGMSSILDKECRLRIAQADDALADIRRQRRIISGLWRFKRLNVDGTGNKGNTRMRTLYNRFNLRTQRCASRYRAARHALLSLNPNGDWQQRLLDLKDVDIRGPGKDDSMASNSRFIMSWIWLVSRVASAPDMPESEEVLDESMRVEWAKSNARSERWEEEVLLIAEEMRRVVAFFEWKARWWCELSTRRTSARDDICHGVIAYAVKQARLCERMAESCASYWLPVLQAKGLSPDWGFQYIPVNPVTVKLDLLHGFEDEDGEEDDEGFGLDGIENDGSDNVVDFFELEP
ncbi:hypothetical protein JOM56_013019 [Amanita muscaria]